MHGGGTGSGAQAGNRNALKHGRYSRELIELRRANPLLRQTRYLHGKRLPNGLPDVAWLAPEGRNMTDADWHEPQRRCLGLHLAGETESLLILLNADSQRRRFILPQGGGADWQILVDTADPERQGSHAELVRAHQPGEHEQGDQGEKRDAAALEESPGDRQRLLRRGHQPIPFRRAPATGHANAGGQPHRARLWAYLNFTRPICMRLFATGG